MEARMQARTGQRPCLRGLQARHRGRDLLLQGRGAAACGDEAGREAGRARARAGGHREHRQRVPRLGPPHLPQREHAGA
jgi:hypothetical protein